MAGARKKILCKRDIHVTAKIARSLVHGPDALSVNDSPVPTLRIFSFGGSTRFHQPPLQIREPERLARPFTRVAAGQRRQQVPFFQASIPGILCSLIAFVDAFVSSPQSSQTYPCWLTRTLHEHPQ